MLKLLIVDDEKLVREMVKLCIDWNEIGFEIVGMASTADEGEALVDALRPDLLITDIRMPHRTGLELARSVLNKYADLKVVIVSGYDEFDYINEGLKIGIFDYVLKPIDDTALRELAIRVRNVILEEHRHTEEFARLKQEFEQNYHYMRERHIERLITSQNMDSAVENLRYFGVELNEGCYQAAILEYKADEEVHQEIDLIQSIQIREHVNQFFEPYPGILIFERYFHRLNIINNCPDADFEALCEQLHSLLDKNLHISTRISIGNRYKDIRQLSISYHEAAEVMRYNLATASDNCICYKNIINQLNQSGSIPESVLRNISYYTKQVMTQESLATVDEIFTNVRTGSFSRDQAIFIALNCTMEAFSAADELKIDSKALGISRAEIMQKILNTPRLSDIHQKIRTLIENIADAFRRQNEVKTFNVVGTVEDYIREHYSDPDLSLSRIAQIVYVNPNYLSRIFKEKTGLTFRQYLLDIRMQNAVLLLKQTSLKAYEVAEKVGIQDPSYFSVCFKKKFGYPVQKLDRN